MSERIFEAAIRLFGEQGYAGTSMRDISDSVGILPGSLYTHISSKEQLLFDIVEDGIDKYLQRLRPCVEKDEPADERLAAVFQAYIEVLAENLDQTVVAFNQWQHLSDDAYRKRIVKMRREYEGLFTKLVEDGLDEGTFEPLSDPRLAVLAIIGLLNAVPQWYSPRGRRSATEVAESLSELVLRGIRTNVEDAARR